MRRLLAVLTATAAVLAFSSTLTFASDKPVDYQDAGATQAEGGQLVTDDGRVTYTVQSDSYLFADRIRLRYTKPGEVNLAPRPANTVWIGDPFRLTLTEWDTNIMLSLRKPAWITVHYDPAELGGRPESWLRIIRYFDSWVQLPITIDPTNHTVTTFVPWGGDYALIAYNSEPPSPPPAPAPASGTSGSGAAITQVVQSAPAGSNISGRFFFDKNGNGVMDGDDYPIDKAAVRISSPDYNAITSTGPDGYYTFQGVPAGTYEVDPVLGAEFDFTTPSAVTGVTVSGQPGSNGSASFGVTYKSWYTPPQ